MPIGKIIALLAEEGDDISNLQIPKDDVAPRRRRKREASPSVHPSTPNFRPTLHTGIAATSALPRGMGLPNTHDLSSHPYIGFLIENGITDAAKIKGTGVRGMLTKGDVLCVLGARVEPTRFFQVRSIPDSRSKHEQKTSQKAAASCEGAYFMT